VSNEGNYGESNLKQKFSRIEQEVLSTYNFTDEQFNELISENFSPNQLQAYIACLDLCGKQIAGEQNNSGLFYLIGGDESDIFYTQVYFKNPLPGTKITLAEDARYTNVEPIDGLIYEKDLEIVNGKRFTQYFKRINSEKPASIAFNLEEGIFFDVKPIELPPAPKGGIGVPVGTIIASTLDYTAFLKANNLDRVDNTNMSKAIWIPCDGRDENGSQYSRYGRIPDLRGVFLRGINEYGVPYTGVGQVSDDRKNPQDKRGGEFQEDAFQGHNHEIRGTNGATGTAGFRYTSQYDGWDSL
jgi:hypothetical protein